MSTANVYAKYGKVIILNGPSAAGKSTTQKAIQSMSEHVYIAVGIDNLFNDIFPDKHGSKVKIKDDPELLRTIEYGNDSGGKPFVKLLVGEIDEKIVLGMNKAIASYAKSGLNIVVDYISYNPDWIADLDKQLEGLEVYKIGVTIPLETLEAREAARGTSPVGHARSHYNYIHKGWNYDLTIDTSKTTPEEAAKKILDLVDK